MNPAGYFALRNPDPKVWPEDSWRKPKLPTERPGVAKVNPEIVRRMRAYRGLGFTLKELATHFGISTAQVGKICRRQVWASVV